MGLFQPRWSQKGNIWWHIQLNAGLQLALNNRSRHSAPLSARLCHSKHVGCHHFWGLPNLGLGHPWADYLVTANVPSFHGKNMSTCKFFCYFLPCALKGHNEGLILSVDSPATLCWDFTSQGIIHSQKRNKGLSAAHLTEKTQIGRVGSRGSYLFAHTFAPEEAFRGKKERAVMCEIQQWT